MNKSIRNITTGFGARLKQERARLGINQADFAEQCGIKRATQFLYETETNSPTLRYLTAANQLGVDIFYVLFGQPEESNEIRLSTDVILDIFDVVYEIGIDHKGKQLPKPVLKQFFAILCSAYTGTQSSKVNMATVHDIMNKIRKAN